MPSTAPSPEAPFGRVLTAMVTPFLLLLMVFNMVSITVGCLAGTFLAATFFFDVVFLGAGAAFFGRILSTSLMIFST